MRTFAYKIKPKKKVQILTGRIMYLSSFRIGSFSVLLLQNSLVKGENIIKPYKAFKNYV